MKKRLQTMLMMVGLSMGLVLMGAQSARAQDADGDGVPDARDNCKDTSNPEIIAFTAGHEVWVGNSNALGAGFTNVSNHANVDQDPAISADGKKVVFSSFRDGSFKIYVVNVDGSNLHRVTDTQMDETEPTFSRDGSKIAFTGYSRGDFQIYVINADGSGNRRSSIYR